MRHVLPKGDRSISDRVSGSEAQGNHKVLSLGAWIGGTMGRKKRSQERVLVQWGKWRILVLNKLLRNITFMGGFSF